VSEANLNRNLLKRNLKDTMLLLGRGTLTPILSDLEFPYGLLLIKG
jgi:hypothetical protein